MKYSVIRQIEGGVALATVYEGIDLSKRDAIKTAKEVAAEHPEDNVFVTWGRASDGQQGYLNRDGNHEITGKRW